MKNWKEELAGLLKSGCTDSDIRQFIQEHKDIAEKDIWNYVSDYYAPEQCKGCKHVQLIGMYPCNVCKRQNLLPDYYKESKALHDNSQLTLHTAVNGCVVKPGQMYRHFKGNLVKILQVAQNSEEPGQYFVVYECGDSKAVWCRPYDMFLSEVDRKKYPNVAQKYRFEFVKE